MNNLPAPKIRKRVDGVLPFIVRKSPAVGWERDIFHQISAQAKSLFQRPGHGRAKSPIVLKTRCATAFRHGSLTGSYLSRYSSGPGIAEHRFRKTHRFCMRLYNRYHFQRALDEPSNRKGEGRAMPKTSGSDGRARTRILHVVCAAIVAGALFIPLMAGAADPLGRARPEQVGMSSDRLARLGEVLGADVEAGRIPGAVVLVMRHGKIAYFDASDRKIRARLRRCGRTRSFASIR